MRWSVTFVPLIFSSITLDFQDGYSVVMARASNGRKNWKVKGTGQTYGQWQEEKLAQAGVALSDVED